MTTTIQTPPFLRRIEFEIIVIQVIELPEGSGIMFRHVASFTVPDKSKGRQYPDTAESGETYDAEMTYAV
jgi:hypothetical protein